MQYNLKVTGILLIQLFIMINNWFPKFALGTQTGEKLCFEAREGNGVTFCIIRFFAHPLSVSSLRMALFSFCHPFNGLRTGLRE